MMFVVEVRYIPNPTAWEVVAKFRDIDAAEKYASRHQGDGGGKLRVGITEDDTPLEHAVDTDVSFTYAPEAAAYANTLAVEVAADVS